MLAGPDEVRKALNTLAGQILLCDGEHESLFLAGIPTRGVEVARRLCRELAARGADCASGSVDISMHRDDLGLRQGVTAMRPTDLPLDLESRTVWLIDDVLHTGRTVRAALEAVLSFGRPRRIRLAVLADRGGRELPIRPDAVGLTVPAGPADRVLVRLEAVDGGGDRVLLA